MLPHEAHSATKALRCREPGLGDLRGCHVRSAVEDAPKLLSLVLAAGNLLNAGTLKANAKGFRLEVLQKLPDTKTDSGMSLLHHLATVAVRGASDVAKTLKAELRKLEETSSIKLSAVESEVQALRRELEAVNREVPLVERGGEADRFHEVMKAFFSKSGDEITSLEKNASGMKESLFALAKFLGEENVAQEV